MKNIAVLAGGYTSERQISLNSGNQILENIDRNLYNAYLIDVRKDGFFCIFNGKEYSVDLNKFAVEIEGKPTKFDYAYLALHGSPGEDGKVQAWLDMLGIPYSACDVFSSMITFNKIAAKKMLADEGIAMAKMAIIRGENPFDVDEIIEKAQIAKGTYYYYFQSKEQMLEEVIDMMIKNEVKMAEQIIRTDISVPQKIVGILTSMKPTEEEQPIKNTLFQEENVLMHHKVRKKLIDTLTPLLSEVIKEGVNEGIFKCDNIPERVKMLLIISDGTFNEGTFTERDISVFIDMTEKLLGAENQTMNFIYNLIDKTDMEAVK
jgi:AcrR family transcriptional regulator